MTISPKNANTRFLRRQDINIFRNETPQSPQNNQQNITTLKISVQVFLHYSLFHLFSSLKNTKNKTQFNSAY